MMKLKTLNDSMSHILFVKHESKNQNETMFHVLFVENETKKGNTREIYFTF